jgi:hypothetical protein
MDFAPCFVEPYTRPANSNRWNASTYAVPRQDLESAASVASAIGDFLLSATGTASALSSIGTLRNSATSTASAIAAANAFLNTVTAEGAASNDRGQGGAEPDRISDALDLYESLENGWLDAASEAPSVVAITRAKNLYKSTKRNGYPPVRSYVSADGEVGLIWQKGRGYGNVGFWPDGSLVYYVRGTDGITEVRDDIIMDTEYLPGELIKALRTF